MPYNNAAIPPREEASGQTTLPIARVKKIVQQDEEIEICSKNALFALTIATELFVQFLAKQGHNIVLAERKPRKIIQYKDMAAAVARIDTLEFLTDVVPRTTTFKSYKEKRAKKASQQSAQMAAQAAIGQTTLDGRFRRRNGVNGADGVSEQDVSGDIMSDDDDNEERKEQDSDADEADAVQDDERNGHSTDDDEQLHRASDTDLDVSMEDASR